MEGKRCTKTKHVLASIIHSVNIVFFVLIALALHPDPRPGEQARCRAHAIACTTFLQDLLVVAPHCPHLQIYTYTCTHECIHRCINSPGGPRSNVANALRGNSEIPETLRMLQWTVYSHLPLPCWLCLLCLLCLHVSGCVCVFNTFCLAPFSFHLTFCLLCLR